MELMLVKWLPNWGSHFLVIPCIWEDHVTHSCQENESRSVSFPSQLARYWVHDPPCVFFYLLAQEC